MITAAFLNHLKSLYPRSANAGTSTSALLNTPWYIIAAVAFSASNNPEAVPRVFEHVRQSLPPTPVVLGSKRAEDESHLLLARRMRDALFKSGLICGYPKAINGLQALHKAMPDELKDAALLRDENKTIQAHEGTGETVFNLMYGETGGQVDKLLWDIYPDMGWFSKTVGYGLVYGGRPDILSPLETSLTIVAALLVGDTLQQTDWHMRNAVRCGGTPEEVRAARSIAIEVAKHVGVQWKNPIPEVDLQ